MDWCTVTKVDGGVNITVTPNPASTSRSGLIDAEIISWVQMAFIQMRSMTISDSKLKSTFFSPKSEKVLKAANKTEAKAAKVLDKKQCISQKEYDLLLSELQKRIDAIDEKLHLSVESEIEAHTSISRLADMRSRLEQQRKDLVAMTVIIDEPEKMQKTVADAKEKEACRQEETCGQRDDNVDKVINISARTTRWACLTTR